MVIGTLIQLGNMVIRIRSLSFSFSLFLVMSERQFLSLDVKNKKSLLLYKVGQGMKRAMHAGLERRDLFVTSKLW